MSKIVSFGEIMLRLNPSGYLRFAQATSFDATYAGAEANTAVSLAYLGNESAFVTKLPDHEIGQNAINDMRKYGVDTKSILRGGARIGVFFVENGASQRGGKVIYDRAGSSIATAGADEFDWRKILRGADWFHVTGITPALGSEMMKATLEAVKTAREMGIKVSCDVNYRAKLWTLAEAGYAMSEIMLYVDVCICNEEQARDVFGIDGTGEGRDYYISIADKIHEKFGCETVALTIRRSTSASDNQFSGMIWQNGNAAFSREYDIHIVDRIGGGDAFSAGLIHALLHSWDLQTAVDFAVAAGCIKQTMVYDFCHATEEEIMNLARGDGAGRVQR